MRTWSSAPLRATKFERDHPLLMHMLIVGAAFATYLYDRDDVVWRFIKNLGADTRPVERGLFLAAALLIGSGAYICTRTRAAGRTSPTTPGRASRSQSNDSLHYLGQLFYAIGLASLLPLAGFIILSVGEAVRLLRLTLASDQPSNHETAPVESSTESFPPNASMPANRISFAYAARLEAVKWALFIAMIVYTITLRDRVADVMIVAGILCSMLVNWRQICNKLLGLRNAAHR